MLRFVAPSLQDDCSFHVFYRPWTSGCLAWARCHLYKLDLILRFMESKSRFLIKYSCTTIQLPRWPSTKLAHFQSHTLSTDLFHLQKLYRLLFKSSYVAWFIFVALLIQALAIKYRHLQLLFLPLSRLLAELHLNLMQPLPELDHLPPMQLVSLLNSQPSDIVFYFN